MLSYVKASRISPRAAGAAGFIVPSSESLPGIGRLRVSGKGRLFSSKKLRSSSLRVDVAVGAGESSVSVEVFSGIGSPLSSKNFSSSGVNLAILILLQAHVSVLLWVVHFVLKLIPDTCFV